MAMRAVFFDRDNTLTCDEGYCHKIEDFAWMPGAETALRALHDRDIPVFIVTNQGGIAKGLFTQSDMMGFHDHLRLMAEQAGGHITDIAFCPHHPQAADPYARLCDCRKPSPKLLFDLAEKWHITLSGSVMIGDKASDIEAGRQAGAFSYLYDPKTRLDTLVNQVIQTHFSDMPL